MMFLDTLTKYWNERKERKENYKALYAAGKEGNYTEFANIIKQHGKVIGVENIEHALGALANSAKPAEDPELLDMIIKTSINLGIDVNRRLPDWYLTRPCRTCGSNGCRDSWIAGPTLITLAASSHNHPMIKALYKNGADPNKGTYNNVTPLMEASYQRNYETVELLSHALRGEALPDIATSFTSSISPAQTNQSKEWATVVEMIDKASRHNTEPVKKEIHTHAERIDLELFKKVLPH